MLNEFKKIWKNNLLIFFFFFFYVSFHRVFSSNLPTTKHWLSAREDDTCAYFVN